jgi:hypothetical protein
MRCAVAALTVNVFKVGGDSKHWPQQAGYRLVAPTVILFSIFSASPEDIPRRERTYPPPFSPRVPGGARRHAGAQSARHLCRPGEGEA